MASFLSTIGKIKANIRNYLFQGHADCQRASKLDWHPARTPSLSSWGPPAFWAADEGNKSVTWSPIPSASLPCHQVQLIFYKPLLLSSWRSKFLEIFFHCSKLVAILFFLFWPSYSHFLNPRKIEMYVKKISPNQRRIKRYKKIHNVLHHSSL